MSKPRTGIPAVPRLGNVVNTSAWGEAKAVERYGSLVDSNVPGGGTRIYPPPPDRHGPEAPQYQHGPGYENRVANDWRRGFGKNGVESGEGKPNFRRGFHGGK
jgi:hypothetical protein